MGLIDLTGQTFGRLTVVSRAANSKSGKARWFCECSCGGVSSPTGASLKRGDTKSCGCLAREMLSERNTSHGLTNHPLYKVWLGVRDRCYNPKHCRFRRYGGRGIEVCERWLGSFENFYNDMLEGYAPGLQIDRVDNDGDYEPSNCRWVTRSENNQNRSDKLDVDLVALSEETGINYTTLYHRYRKGDRGERLLRQVKHGGRN